MKNGQGGSNSPAPPVTVAAFAGYGWQITSPFCTLQVWQTLATTKVPLRQTYAFFPSAAQSPLPSIEVAHASPSTLPLTRRS